MRVTASSKPSPQELSELWIGFNFIPAADESKFDVFYERPNNFIMPSYDWCARFVPAQKVEALVTQAKEEVFRDLIAKAKPHFGTALNDVASDLLHEAQVNFWKWLRKEAEAAKKGGGK